MNTYRKGEYSLRPLIGKDIGASKFIEDPETPEGIALDMVMTHLRATEMPWLSKEDYMEIMRFSDDHWKQQIVDFCFGKTTSQVFTNHCEIIIDISICLLMLGAEWSKSRAARVFSKHHPTASRALRRIRSNKNIDLSYLVKNYEQRLQHVDPQKIRVTQPSRFQT